MSITFDAFKIQDALFFRNCHGSNVRWSLLSDMFTTLDAIKLRK